MSVSGWILLVCGKQGESRSGVGRGLRGWSTGVATVHLGDECRVDGGDRWMSAHMGPPQLRVLYLSVVLRLNCLLWGNASPLTALENDNRRAGSKD